ncbi:MAG: integrase family protein [Dactylosporangium sp.]|jgi:integrase/recombinase XerD|nr:integrase family protein [Dactylosporangium sp.]
MSWSGLRLHRSRNTAGDLVVRFGVALLDAYLEFLAVRSRPNTVVAVAYDLKVFFTVVGKPPRRVVAADVLGFVTAQYAGGRARRLQAVGEGRVSARTVRRRLSSVSGLFAFLQARGDVAANPVPRGLPTRRERQRPRQGVPLVRTPRTLPRVLEPAQVDALLAALRTHRDRAMAEAMVLGGLRRCEVLGLRLADLQVAARRRAGRRVGVKAWRSTADAIAPSHPGATPTPASQRLCRKQASVASWELSTGVGGTGCSSQPDLEGASSDEIDP